jgi:uncharacterized protein YjbJ (UPF0337 family)
VFVRLNSDVRAKPEEGGETMSEKFKGKAKEVEGVVRDDEAKKREGQTQQEADKAAKKTAERKKKSGGKGLLGGSGPL